MGVSFGRRSEKVVVGEVAHEFRQAGGRYTKQSFGLFALFSFRLSI